MKKFIVLSIVLLMLAGFAITSSAMDVTLYAGQTINVGNLNVVVSGGNLVVTYAIDAPWVLVETHLYVGTSPPAKSAPGQFPYGPGGAVYTISLTELNAELGDILYIAAHAVVTNTCEETAWARRCFNYDWDFRIPPGKNWASYFEFIQ